LTELEVSPCSSHHSQYLAVCRRVDQVVKCPPLKRYRLGLDSPSSQT